jgi:hypothetical protein
MKANVEASETLVDAKHESVATAKANRVIEWPDLAEARGFVIAFRGESM